MHLRIWRYFHEFGAERHNYLIPDNVEEDGLFEAARVSPTNVGLLLNARQAACEFGFLTVPEFVALTNRSLATIERLEKYRGHLYNWYDTQTLEPLSDAPFVSSVDSGNFVASLYTLRSGALALLRQPLLARQLFSGLRAHWQMMRLQRRASSLVGTSVSTCRRRINGHMACMAIRRAGSRLPRLPVRQPRNNEDAWWLTETQHRVSAILALLQDYMPWLLSEYAPLREVPELAIEQNAYTLTIDEAIAFSEHLERRLVQRMASTPGQRAAACAWRAAPRIPASRRAEPAIRCRVPFAASHSRLSVLRKKRNSPFSPTLAVRFSRSATTCARKSFMRPATT